ncbi:hypothetical protein DL95DRAFT_278249, partial [Leptodontidium sp. 2 PMI_412]
MSFGSSVGDIILLIQLAHKNYRNCKEAGGEYIEIAREVRSLHSVLRTVRDEAERKDSLIFNAGPGKTKELTEIADGCKGRYQAMESVLSLSTYADDDKEVWRQFRSQLVSLGFKSDSLDRHMEVLKAYMMKLDQ